MNREIKFRAWDNEAELWRYFSLDQAIVGLMKPFAGIISRICESTGLKDKNGEEIYEGDICVVGLENPYPDCIVTWERDGWKWGRRIATGEVITIFEMGAPSMDNIEVIGNIYENPELLKVETKPSKE